MSFEHVSHDAIVLWNKILQLRKSILHIYTYRFSIKYYYTCPSSGPNLPATYLSSTSHYNLILLKSKTESSLPCLSLQQTPFRGGPLGTGDVKAVSQIWRRAPLLPVLLHTKLCAALVISAALCLTSLLIYLPGIPTAPSLPGCPDLKFP